MRVLRPALAGLILLACAGGWTGCSTTRPVAPSPEAGRLLRQGTVQVDPLLRCVVVTGYLNMVEGPIELMACGPGGKVHESVLVLEANPVDLQAALLLIGLRAGPPMKELGVGPPLGDLASIWVEWQQAGQRVVRPLEELAYSWRDKAPLKTSGWVFTGSLFEDGKFKALAEESMIASYWDPWSILNVHSSLGADDEALSVNTNAVPALHTPVRLLIQRP